MTIFSQSYKRTLLHEYGVWFLCKLFHKAKGKRVFIIFCFRWRRLVDIRFNQQRKKNIISHLYKAVAKVYWNACIFHLRGFCCWGDNTKRGSKSFPSMLADEMQTQSNQAGQYIERTLKCQSRFHSSCVWWEIIEWENLLIYANTLSALICSEGIFLY